MASIKLTSYSEGFGIFNKVSEEEFEERIRKVIDEVRVNQGILLFIDEAVA